jgi:murein DD-endopeptidase MepM/ murein hydrolase activator NlpD
MKKALIISSIAIILLLMSTKKAFAKITALNSIRGCDQSGCGNFGASRGTRSHNGVDIKAAVGEKIFSPISGKVTRYPIPYSSDLRYSGIEIENNEYKVKMFYLSPSIPVGNFVTAGQAIGTAQNIAAKYTNPMTNHVHVEVYAHGKLIDPTNLIK